MSKNNYKNFGTAGGFQTPSSFPIFHDNLLKFQNVANRMSYHGQSIPKESTVSEKKTAFDNNIYNQRSSNN